MQTRNETIYETATFFKDKKQPVHITLESGRWMNGIILSVDKDFKDRLVLEEERYGEILIFFERIIDDGIVPREVKK